MRSLSPTASPARRRRAFTILELMVVAAIIGLIAAISLPLYSAHMLRSKTAEAKTNLGSLRVAQESFHAEHDVYYAAAAEPALIPGAQAVPFDSTGSDFADLSWTPEGPVYFSYAVAVSADGSGYTADAGADLDADGIVQLWGLMKPDSSGATQNGSIGCPVSFLSPSEVGRCGTDPSIY